MSHERIFDGIKFDEWEHAYSGKGWADTDTDDPTFYPNKSDAMQAVLGSYFQPQAQVEDCFVVVEGDGAGAIGGPFTQEEAEALAESLASDPEAAARAGVKSISVYRMTTEG